MNKIIIIAALSILASEVLNAQNSHYWTQQYGNQSLLLGGAVTGSVTDLGSVYYNPGFLALQENAAFSITAKLLQFTNVSIEDGLGDNIDLNKNTFGNAPGLIAGVFSLNFLPKSKFAYAYLTRRSNEIDFVYRTQGNFDVLPNNPGTEEFTGEIILIDKNNEYWGGWSWSYPLNENIGIGLSNFFTITSSKSELNIDLAALAPDNHIVTLNRVRQYEYNNYGMIFKAGIAIKYPKFSAGIAITAPKINITGTGFMYTKTIMAGMDTSYTTSGNNFFETNYQDNLPTTLKSPISIAAGAGYKLNKFTLHISGEWFDKVNKYTVMTAEPFVGQSTGNTHYNSIVEELSSIINGGVALEYRFNDRIHYYGGFSTDISAASANQPIFTELEKEIDNASFRANIYHFSGGIGLNFEKIHITTGLAYNFGLDTIARPVNLPDDNDSPIFDPSEKAILRINNWKMLFGFSFPVSKKDSR